MKTRRILVPPTIENAICWNGMTPRQQLCLSNAGDIFDGEYGGGPCPNKAAVKVQIGNRHGPRFYCQTCADAMIGSKVIK